MTHLLTRQKRIEICKGCENKYLDIKSGLLCGITNEKPSFAQTCDDFKAIDESYKSVAHDILDKEKNEWRAEMNQIKESYKEQRKFEEISRQNRREELRAKYEQRENRPLEEKKVHNGANWFYWIAALSFLNSILLLTEIGGQFIIGLGMTQILEAVMYEILNEKNIVILIPSLVISILFITIGIYANRYSKIAFIAGIVIYGIDTLIFLLFKDYLSFGFHLFAIFMIITGFRNLKYIDTKETNVQEE